MSSLSFLPNCGPQQQHHSDINQESARDPQRTCWAPPSGSGWRRSWPRRRPSPSSCQASRWFSCCWLLADNLSNKVDWKSTAMIKICAYFVCPTIMYFAGPPTHRLDQDWGVLLFTRLAFRRGRYLSRGHYKGFDQILLYIFPHKKFGALTNRWNISSLRSNSLKSKPRWARTTTGLALALKVGERWFSIFFVIGTFLFTITSFLSQHYFCNQLFIISTFLL